MKRFPLYALVLLVAAGTVWVSGCSTPGTPEDTSLNIDEIINRTEAPDLNDAFGGFNMKDESPAFGDASMLAEYGEDETYDDPFANDAQVRNMEMPDREQIFLMITWGNLHRDSTVAGPTDWSGALKVDNGMVLLKRTIRFERNDMILPRTSRDLLEWQSHTHLGMDGVLVKIHPHPTLANSAAVTDTIDSTSVVISFKTAPLSVEFTLADLPNLDRVVTLDDGNAVAFTAIYIVPNSCPAGFLRGEWRNRPERQGGVFRGRWATADGQVKGFIKGIYGRNDAGEKVFYGKMIDDNGRFQGIVRGQWENEPGINAGWFAGRWVDRHLDIRGALKGEWRRSDRCHGGFFRGRWAMDCRDVL